MFAAVLLLLTSLICAPVFAAEVEGLSVDVPNHQGKYVGDNIIDGDPATAWVGGGKGIGPGKYIEIDFPSPVALESLRIYNGNQGKNQFKKYRRITKGVILYPDETRQKFTLKPNPGEQKIKLKSVTADSIKIIITGVAPSSKDKTLGKAKVAVSEIKVYGTVTEGDEDGEGEDSEDGEPDDGDAALEDEESDEPEAAAPVKKEAPKPEPKPVEKVESKPEPEPEPEPAPVVKKTEPKVEAKSAPEKAVAKESVKKAAPKKAAPKKKVAKKKAKPAVSKSQPGITRMRPASPVPADKDMNVGVINPWLDLEFVAQIKRYFALLTTLHDSYPEVFSSEIRERERKAFLVLQDQMRTKKEFGRHHIAMLEHIGLNFDKPVIRNDSATVRVHGPYRYYLENDAFEFKVDTLFSFTKVDGKWLISGVKDK